MFQATWSIRVRLCLNKNKGGRDCGWERENERERLKRKRKVRKIKKGQENETGREGDYPS